MVLAELPEIGSMQQLEYVACFPFIAVVAIRRRAKAEE
jgi:hypothetical protein